MPLPILAENAARWALVFGSVDGVLDHPAGEATDTPYLTLYTPENKLDWELDGRGQYRWVKYREVKMPRPSWDGERERITEYRILLAPEGARKGGTILYRSRVRQGRPEVIEVFDGRSGE